MRLDTATVLYQVCSRDGVLASEARFQMLFSFTSQKFFQCQGYQNVKANYRLVTYSMAT